MVAAPFVLLLGVVLALRPLTPEPDRGVAATPTPSATPDPARAPFPAELEGLPGGRLLLYDGVRLHALSADLRRETVADQIRPHDLSPDGARLLATSEPLRKHAGEPPPSRHLLSVDPATGERRVVSRIELGEEIRHSAWAPDGRIVHDLRRDDPAGEERHELCIVDAEDAGRECVPLDGPVTGLEWPTPDRILVAAGSVRVLDPRDGAMREVFSPEALEGHDAVDPDAAPLTVGAVSGSPSGFHIAAVLGTGDDAGVVAVLDRSGGLQRVVPWSGARADEVRHAVAWHPTTDFLAVPTETPHGSIVRLIDDRGRERSLGGDELDGRIRSAVWGPDGRWVAAGTRSLGAARDMLWLLPTASGDEPGRLDLSIPRAGPSMRIVGWLEADDAPRAARR